MKQLIIFLLVFLSVVICNCTNTKQELQRVNLAWLDSIKASSDTVYTKQYRNEEFATATYFVNKKDSIVYQVMKDSKGAIRQILGAKKNIRLFIAEYFPNGQLKASLQLDKDGKYEGNAIAYYENGAIKSEGRYRQGFYKGQWKNYSENGKLISIEEYDANGQLINSISK